MNDVTRGRLTYSRDQLIALQNDYLLEEAVQARVQQLFSYRRRGCRAGDHVKRRQLLCRHAISDGVDGRIQTIVGNRPVTRRTRQPRPPLSPTSTPAQRLQPPVLVPIAELRPTERFKSTSDDTGLTITDTDNNATVASDLSFELSNNEHVISPLIRASSSPITDAVRHPTDNHQQASDVSMNCSHWTDTSTNTLISDNSLLSPGVPQSPDSEPPTSFLSNNCTQILSNDDFDVSNTSHTEPSSPISTTIKPLTKGKNRFYFPRLWTCNLRGGFCSKLDEITEVILANEIDVAILVETWLHVNILDSLITIPGYDIYRKDRADGRSGGGILVYVRHGLPCALLPQINNTDIEVLWLLYRGSCMPREVSHILIGAVYHPPKANSGHMIEHLISSMDTISRQHPYTGIMILGDFNQLPDGQLRSYPLRQLVTGPTRNLALLDKIYTNIGDWFETPVLLPAITKSDHDSVLIVPSQKGPLRPRRQTIELYRRSSDPNGKAMLCHCLKRLDWRPLFMLQQCSSMVDLFYSVILSLLDYYLPIIKVTRSSTDKPWVTPSFRRLVKSRQRAFLSGDVTRYHRLRNRTQRTASTLRKNYFAAKIEQLHSCDPRQWWVKTKRILNYKHTNPLTNLQPQGTPHELAEQINHFFVSVSEHLPKVDSSILADLKNDYCSDYIIDPVEVANRLANINIYKAPGPDGLPNWLLRDFAPYLCEPLAAIFNASIREGFIPPIWKSAEVIAVPKIPRPRSIQTDLRPISLLPTVAKVLESFIGGWLQSVLEPSLDDKQYGCRPNRSTTHALMAITHEWQSALDRGGAVRALLIDFRKAFDLVNHNFLLQKLLNKNVPHCLINWFYSYLDHRMQRVRIANEYSEWLYLNGAMPQGSWLGPLSFLVLIDDLNVDCLIHKYVDDTTLTEPLCVQSQPTSMQYFFQQLQCWANDNDMVVNLNKTKEIVMGPPSKTSHLLPLQLSTGHIERVNSVKLLGINLDADFAWKTHVEAITSKATQRLYFLKQLRRAGVPQNQLLHFYTAVIRPVLEYAAPVWNHLLTKTQIDQIEAIQRRALRIIFSYTSDMPYTSALYCAAIPSLADRREHLARKFFKSVLEPSSCLFTLLPTPRDPAITARLRSANKFPRIPTRTRKYQTFISYALSHYQSAH